MPSSSSSLSSQIQNQEGQTYGQNLKLQNMQQDGNDLKEGGEQDEEQVDESQGEQTGVADDDQNEQSAGEEEQNSVPVDQGGMSGGSEDENSQDSNGDEQEAKEELTEAQQNFENLNTGVMLFVTTDKYGNEATTYNLLKTVWKHGFSYPCMRKMSRRINNDPKHRPQWVYQGDYLENYWTNWHHKQSVYWDKQDPTEEGTLGQAKGENQEPVRIDHSLSSKTKAICENSGRGWGRSSGRGRGGKGPKARIPDHYYIPAPAAKRQPASKAYHDNLSIMWAKTDKESSVKILNQFVQQMPKQNRVLEVGAGVGRVTRFLFKDVFENIDVLDQGANFIETAEVKVPFVKDFYCSTLQDFSFPNDTKYDCIWIQGVLLYLTDRELIASIQNCAKHLSEAQNDKSGLIFVKENVVTNKEYEAFVGSCAVFEEDHSIVRGKNHFQVLFEYAGLEVVNCSKTEFINGDDLLETWTWVLRNPQNIE